MMKVAAAGILVGVAMFGLVMGNTNAQTMSPSPTASPTEAPLPSGAPQTGFGH